MKCSTFAALSVKVRVDWVQREKACNRCFLHTSAEMWPEHLEIVNAAQPVESPQTRETILDAGRFSRWAVAVHIMATVLRWIPHVRDHLQGEFSAELSDLEAGKQVHKSRKIYSQSPMLKNGLICVDTSLSRCPHLSGVAMFPPFLPSDHPYMELLIEHLHHKMGHRTQEAVMLKLRMRCWFPRARQAICQIKNRCRMYKILKGKPESDEEAMTLKYHFVRGRNVTVGHSVRISHAHGGTE